MKKLLGYILLCAGFIGFVFFINYKGSAIPLKELWLVLSLFIIIAGSYFIIKHKLQLHSKHQNNVDGNMLAQIEQLKNYGEKIKVTLENAEVKSRIYNQENISSGMPTRIEMLDSLYDSNRNSKSTEIQQTYIVVHRQYNNKTYKFISQATTQSSDAVKEYIESKQGVNLYIDPNNPANYYFDQWYL